MDRNYEDMPMENILAIITEEVNFSGDSFGWVGDIPTPLLSELVSRGIVPEEGMFGTWNKDPSHTGKANDIPFLVYKAAHDFREGRDGPLNDDELRAWGSSSFKLGNHKIGEDTIIFNMTSGHDCPNRNKCDIKGNCYAVADEKLWKTPLDFRRRQNAFWDHTTIDQFIAAIPIPKYFRFSEAGDFRTQVDVDRMTIVAKELKKKGITTYGYTNSDYLDFSELMKVAVVNGHGFMLNNKTVIKKKAADGDLICPGDCRDCDWCKVASNKTIVFEKRSR